jgi:hypothetical protein
VVLDFDALRGEYFSKIGPGNINHNPQSTNTHFVIADEDDLDVDK